MFLNTWEAATGEVLWNYLKEESENCEVFCFMETGDKFRRKCKEILSNYVCITDKKVVVNKNEYFQSTYVRVDNKILKSETLLRFDPCLGLGIFTQIQRNNKVWNVANIHGVAKPGDKLDNPKRLEQSQKIIEYMAKIDGIKLIGGDFNLEIETESVKMFEKNGYRNLIKEFGIETTRNHFSWDIYPQKQLWADYLFVSPEVKVKSFEVPRNEVSDHLPLIVEIEG